MVSRKIREAMLFSSNLLGKTGRYVYNLHVKCERQQYMIMNIKSRIPKEFYKLFSSKYLEYYQRILTAIYEESGRSYSLLGLTQEECQEIIQETISSFTLDWTLAQIEDEGEMLTRSNMASIMLRRLEEWGWLRRDYDEQLNEYVVSFPDYSQIFIEIFVRLFQEDVGMERESILAIYSHLFTYNADKEKNNEILKSALQTSRALLQMLVNMQEGIRGYFDALSKETTFLGVQGLLVEEINNTDSKKYAILTTTDSFYRYKEAVKELLDSNLSKNEERKQRFVEKRAELTPESVAWNRNERAIATSEEAMDILLKINREFDSIERRYNRLIDQKRLFAKRAAARIQYIISEGEAKQDCVKGLIQLLNTSTKQEEILQKLACGYGMTQHAQVIREQSFSRPRMVEKREFMPQKIQQVFAEEAFLEDFVVKPLYTQTELDAFRKKNDQNGTFHVGKDTVNTIEDLEKLLFIWQEATEISENNIEIELGEEFTTKDHLTYTGFSVRECK